CGIRPDVLALRTSRQRQGNGRRHHPRSKNGELGGQGDSMKLTWTPGSGIQEKTRVSSTAPYLRKQTMSDPHRRDFLAGTAGLAAAAVLLGSRTARAGDPSFMN